MNRLKIIEDSDSQKVWVVQPIFTESDWPLFLMIRLYFTDAWNSEWSKQVGKYYLEIHAVSTEAAGPENCGRAATSHGLVSGWAEVPVEYQHLVLLEYGTSAHLWSKGGNNWRELLRQARSELKIINVFFGFYMDKAQNRIGSTGWDFIRGDPTAGLIRPRQNALKKVGANLE